MPVDVRAADQARDEARVAKAQGAEQARAELALERGTACPLGDQAEEDVVRARVGERAAGRVLARVSGRDRDQFLGHPSTACVAEHPLVLDVVEQPGRMRQQLANGDRPTVRQEIRKPALDGVVEREPAVLDEAEHERGHEGLRDAPDPKPLVATHRDRRLTLGDASRLAVHVPVLSQDHESARRAGGHDLVEELAEARLVVAA